MKRGAGAACVGVGGRGRGAEVECERMSIDRGRGMPCIFFWSSRGLTCAVGAGWRRWDVGVV